MLALLLAFQIKHFVIDFLLQFPWMYLNKGNLEHPGGWAHASLHALGTMLVLGFLYTATPSWMTIPAIFMAMVVDLFTHALIDAGKINICKEYNWQPTTSEYYWWTLGADQFLHQCVYLFILWLIISI